MFGQEINFLNIIFPDDDEDEEEYVNFVVIDEFYEKFGPAVSIFKMLLI